MTSSLIQQYLLMLVVIFFGFDFVKAQYVPGEAYFGTNGYIEYYAGDLPIIISAAHGGYLTPSSIPDRTCSGCVTGRDLYTEDLAYLIKDAIKIVFGQDPHIIINKLARIKLDANREIVEAAQGNPEAETAWYEFHEFIQDSKDSTVANYGTALYIDLHAHGHDIQRIEIGYLLTRTELQHTDLHLNDFNFQDSTAIKHLKNVLNPTTLFSDILRGSNCMGDFLEEHNYPCVPSSSIPAPAPTDPYFSGGYNLVRHGSRDSSVINAIQFELNWTDIRNSDANRKKFADALACVFRRYLNEWYFELDSWDPGNLVTSTADSGNGSLRSALLGASDGDVILFDIALEGDTIRLESELQICSNLTIRGLGADKLAISGGDSVRLFRTIAHDSLNIEGLSLVRGKSPIGEDGGAIVAGGSVRLSGCIITNNFADDDGGAVTLDAANKVIVIDSCLVANNQCNDDGGALRLTNGSLKINASTFKNNFSPSYGGALWSSGTIEIANSTFSNNTASSVGGAIRNYGSGVVRCTNSTFSNNTANYRGGALSTAGLLYLTNCTIAYNNSISLGGGIRITEGGLCNLKNTIVSENSGSNGSNISMFMGTITSEGYNIIEDTIGSGWIPATGDILGNTANPVELFIGQLQDNGGFTQTIALEHGSPAIDKADPLTALATDQRGANRVFCNRSDVGALELQLDTLVWTGLIDSEWLNSGNWNPNFIPTNCNVVKVPSASTAPFQPIISSPKAECRDILLRPMSSLKLLNSGDLKVKDP